MDVLGFTEARARLGAVLEAVVADHNPVVITRRSGGAVVLVSLADWRARAETEHLLSTPGNASRLVQAVGELDAGREP